MITTIGILLGATIGAAAVDLLALSTTRVGASLPPSWSARPVRGQRAPRSLVADSAGQRFLRLSGTGAAGWFVHRLAAPITASGEATPPTLVCSWRVLRAPAGADLRVAATDDSALRLFVVFASRRRLDREPPTLFYSVGSAEPVGYTRASFQSRKLFVIRIGADSATSPTAWTETVVNPFADYQRIWRETPPPIVAVGFLQDTEQTRTTAVADIRTLDWRRPHASP